ncbi:unnamed protein product [Cylindrotheca closterium]|uniref:Uncharacterized protein n=1 Tax=Cylindrotheca closterium TaxID=2856 RepID=A0AAD2CUZ1_9STRA|nr:unnamed protein product [Cylindrotheca closterium]
MKFASFAMIVQEKEGYCCDCYATPSPSTKQRKDLTRGHEKVKEMVYDLWNFVVVAVVPQQGRRDANRYAKHPYKKKKKTNYDCRTLTPNRKRAGVAKINVLVHEQRETFTDEGRSRNYEITMQSKSKPGEDLSGTSSCHFDQQA